MRASVGVNVRADGGEEVRALFCGGEAAAEGGEGGAVVGEDFTVPGQVAGFEGERGRVGGEEEGEPGEEGVALEEGLEESATGYLGGKGEVER